MKAGQDSSSASAFQPGSSDHSAGWSGRPKAGTLARGGLLRVEEDAGAGVATGAGLLGAAGSERDSTTGGAVVVEHAASTKAVSRGKAD